MPPKRKPPASEQDEEFNCSCCDKPDSAEDMVQCDRCEMWNHFSCANVNSSIRDKAFLCRICQGRSVASFSVASFSGTDSASVVGWVTTKSNLNASVQLLSSVLATTTAIANATEPNNVNVNDTTTTSIHFPMHSTTEVAVMCGNASDTSSSYVYGSPAYSTTDVAVVRGSVSDPSTNCVYELPAHRATEAAAMCGNFHRAAADDAMCEHILASPASTTRFYQPNAAGTSISSVNPSVMPPQTKTSQPNAQTLMTNSHNIPLSSLRNKTNKDNYVIEQLQQKTRFRSNESMSPNGSANKRLQIELQRIEEERQLIEIRDKEELMLRRQRDAEYISKKYKAMSLADDLFSDEGEIVDEVKCLDRNRVVKTNSRRWIEGTMEKVYSHTKTNADANPNHFPPSIPQQQNINESWGCSGIQSSINFDRQPTGPTAATSHLPFAKSRESAYCQKQEHQQLPLLMPTSLPHQIFHRSNGWAPESLSSTRHHLSDNNQEIRNLTDSTQPLHSFDNIREFMPHSLAAPPLTRNLPASTHHPSSFENAAECTFSNSFLTKNNLAARQLIRDLPAFDGDPSEWPLFIASFNRSTELGRFSDEENLIRLHKALKGSALEAVRSLIIQPNCVGRVIDTLKMLYGRPELIINTLIRKISSTPPPKAEKLDSIVTFAIAVQNLCATVEACGITDHLNYPMLTQELVEKLPPSLRLNWAIHKQSLSSCTLMHFSRWMFSLAEAANGVLATAPSTNVVERKAQKGWKDKAVVNAHYTGNTRQENQCYICEGICASVAECKKFKEANRTIRWEEVRKHNLCRRCLKRHLGSRCQSESICGENNCTRKHHRLLHNVNAGQGSPTNGTVGVHSKELSVSKSYVTDPVLFRVVPVFLYGRGTRIKTFAFLDDGSSVTLIDKEIAKKLNVQGTPRPLCLKWTGNTSRYENDSELISLQISSTSTNPERFQVADIHTVSKLCLPTQTMNPDELKQKFEHLKGLDLPAYCKATPRILIGVNNAQLGFPLKSKEGYRHEPVATKTRLGWVLHGKNSEREVNLDKSFSLHACECNGVDLHSLVNKFICDDNFGTLQSAKVPISDDDSRALDLLQKHTVLKNGRYETALLWKFDTVQLPDSYPMARRRLLCLQKRMQRDPVLAKKLESKINEYVNKGYACKITPQEQMKHQERSWYLPVFPVENANKPGKIRIVWDAAAAVRGTSLNSLLLKGPDQLTSLTSVLYKFRQDKIAICGDIMEMFHQIGIREDDQHFQRFLWGGDESRQPDVYIMTVMTFGATCSPCAAHFVKNTNADKFVAEFPRAVRAIKENHYVDDLMDSVPTEQEAIKLAKEIRHIHSQGGFHIRNWVSNSTAVLKALQSTPTEELSMNLNVELSTEKVLGMWWCTPLDSLTFKITSDRNQRQILFDSKRPTKREVLRVMMTIFDPLGLIACLLMYVKILLQEIWRSKIDWDDEIKDEEYHKWLKWTYHLSKIEELRIPRCYVSSDWGSEIQLHIFVDASENGFAAVAYIRNLKNELTETALIGAKTRVAPLKALTIPRLELQAALLGARFAKSIIDSHGITFKSRYFWSDSKTVLCWLRSDHRRYRQYVAFRVSEILELTDVTEWRWIPTHMNVADEATKWQRPPEFKSTSRWFNGPTFLKSTIDEWPQEVIVGSTIEELKTHFVSVHNIGQENIFRSHEISTWRKLLRSTAYALRFVNNTSTRRNKTLKVSGPLLRSELQSAENALVREAQKCVYAEEIADLTMNRGVERSSPLFNLNPFLDENHLIRANGRISLKQELNQDLRLPVILPRYHRITVLIIEDVHCHFNHQSDETVVNTLRQKFYISQLRSALKAIKKLCPRCKINKARPHPPIMAPLPQARLASFCRPFSYVGVDYFGPLCVTVGRRTEKRWGVLLTCLTVRAVHIEVAHTLTTDSCILCLRNFIARRGTPIEFHSDNGTNFCGAERELREAAASIRKDKLMETFTTTITQWKFIPPGSPHMGDSWERLVRSIKNVLYSIMPSRNPNDELLRSMLIESENIVNSRPLTYIPIDPTNPEALTPNHFLLGSQCGSKPLAQFDDDATVLRKNWLISQQFADRFWKRWIAEYLPTLTRRTKWLTPAKPLEVGDLVLIVDPTNPRNIPTFNHQTNYNSTFNNYILFFLV
ncbi:uncharacterized protein LOC129950533 [Eupeodes corollae]|uniref:uncharacterized protein LOC129950533 n=1 Tax=Eupeodes corollae TaxID=290404 RepID=UPI00249112CE|nr:uncharacterized protein LOC129950533 [Eupeodes corollae]